MVEPSANLSAPRTEAGPTRLGPPSEGLPRRLGRLILLRLIARGGMGDVFLATTSGIEGAERPVVVKTIRQDFRGDASYRARFLDEARVQAQLHHAGVAQILEASLDDQGHPYTVVEFVEGRSLAEVRQRVSDMGARIGWVEAVALTLEVARALAHVHERTGPDGSPLSIVHRDLSPQNVMVGYAGHVKIIDFGTARGRNRKCHTVAGVVFAKPGYIAPEVARQQIGDARIDLYALGVMLWEMAASRRFLGSDAAAHLTAVAENRWDTPAIAPSIGAPPMLDEILRKLLANDPNDRYPLARTAAADLARLLGRAPAGPHGERSVQLRIAAFMKTLWPDEPDAFRREFAHLLEQAHRLPQPTDTPGAKSVTPAASEDPQLLPGTSYRLLGKVGQGAAGTVFEAEHTGLKRRVAIKLLLPEHGTSTTITDALKTEAQTLARLAHPHLVSVFDLGQSSDGRVYLTMELLEGESLDVRLANRLVLPEAEALDISIDAAKALEAIHAAGFVHRDLKPENLFLTKAGPVKLLDFGVATLLERPSAPSLEEASTATAKRTYAVFGTPEYMAPEQASGEAVDARADIYGLGAVLYEMVTGSCVFSSASGVTVLTKHLHERPVPPRTRAPDRRISSTLERIILRCLEKDRNARFPSATALREELERLRHRPRRLRALGQRAAMVTVAGGLSATLALMLAPKGSSLPTPPGEPSESTSMPTSGENPLAKGRTPLPAGASASTLETAAASRVTTQGVDGGVSTPPFAPPHKDTETARAPKDHGHPARGRDAIPEPSPSPAKRRQVRREAR